MLEQQTKLGFLGAGYVSQAALQSGSTLSAGTLHRDDGQTFPWQGLAPFSGAGIPAYINRLIIPGAPHNVPGARDEAWVSGPVPTAYAGRTGALGSTSAWLITDGIGKTYVVSLNGDVSRPGGPPTLKASRSGDLPSGGVTCVKTSANGKLALLYTGMASQAWVNTANYACYQCDVTLDASGAGPVVSLHFTRIELGGIYTNAEGLVKDFGAIYAAIAGNTVVQTHFVTYQCSHLWYFSFDTYGSYQTPVIVQASCGVESSQDSQWVKVDAYFECWGGTDYRNVSLTMTVMGTVKTVTGNDAIYALQIDNNTSWNYLNFANRASSLITQLFDVVFANTNGSFRNQAIDVASASRLLPTGSLGPTAIVKSSGTAKYLRAMSPDKVYLSDNPDDRSFFFT